MPDWGAFLTGGATGGAVGIVISGLTSNATHELLEEWRDRQAEKRDRAREIRAELRALREAKRERLHPILDGLFMVTETVLTEARQLLAEIERGQGGDGGPGDGLYSPDMATAMERVAEAILAIRREMDAPALVSAATVLRAAYDELDAELSRQDPEGSHSPMRRIWISAMLQEIQGQAATVQQAVLSAKRALDAPG